MLVWATAVPGGTDHLGQGRCLAVWATAAFVDGRGSRHAAGHTLLAEAGAPAASGCGSWRRRRGGKARPWRPTRGRWRGRRGAAPRTAPAAPRSAGPGPGAVKCPPTQNIEQKFEAELGILLTATAAVSLPGHAWALDVILPAFCPTALHRAAQPRITLNAQVAWTLADQRERDCGEPSRTEPNESHPAENRKVGRSARLHN
jgi:hypothetical protein